MDIELRTSKKAVMEEVACATSYAGAKMEEDAGAFARISTVDEDEGQLERFWEECRAELCQELIGLVSNERIEGTKGAEEYVVTLDVSSAFDDVQLPSMQISLGKYFVVGIVAKWYAYTNKKEAGEYADKAGSLLEDLHRKAVYKKRPKRPTYE